MNRRRPTRRGFTTVVVAFLLLVSLTVGTYLFSLSLRESAVPTKALLAVRAHAAAQSGLEWGAHRAVNGAAGACAALPAVATTSFTLDDAAVTVTCGWRYNASGGNWVYAYFLTSTAAAGTPGTTDYAERKLEGVLCRSSSPAAAEC